MEGAVRSGYLAADAMLSRFLPAAAATLGSFIVGDLPAQWTARALGYR